MEWHEWLMYGLVVVLTILKILEYFGIDFKNKKTKLYVSILRQEIDGPPRFIVTFKYFGDKKVSFIGFEQSTKKLNDIQNIHKRFNSEIKNKQIFNLSIDNISEKKSIYLNVMFENHLGRKKVYSLDITEIKKLELGQEKNFKKPIYKS